MTNTPLSAHAAVAAYAQRDNLRATDGVLLWLESDSSSGNTCLMQYHDGDCRRLTPPDVSVRSQVNGYGGGAFCVLGQSIYFVSGADQQVHRLAVASGDTQVVTGQGGARFGALVADYRRDRVLAVCEYLDEGFGVGQALVAIDVQSGAVEQLVGEFRGKVNMGCPTLSADGYSIAWVEWALPRMPWDKTRLRRAVLDEAGAVVATEDCSITAPAAIQQPRFVGRKLYALSDHAGWWQPYRVDDFSRWTVQSMDHTDCANAPWQLDERHYAWLERNRWVRILYHKGLASLVIMDEAGRILHRLAETFTDFSAVQVMNHQIYVIGRRTDALDSVLRIDPDTLAVTCLAGGEQTPACLCMVPPEPFRFVARDDQEVHGYLYRPSTEAPAPVVMRVHGGPTSAAYPVFDPQIAFWTSHGFAVADVNYRGSSGYGRAFRMSLAGHWGKWDHEDICDAVRYLGESRRVDAARAFVMGRSAGGFTVLNALINSDVFRAGASLFGVSDPESLRHMTHRFESGYLDWLLGDPAEQLTVWQARTPLFWADRIQCPVIFFQGEQDVVVVPEQTDAMAHVLDRCGIPVEVVRFADEGHGFRHAENQAAVLNRLLQFFKQ